MKFFLLSIAVISSFANAELPPKTLVEARFDTFACKSAALTAQANHHAEKKEQYALAVLGLSERCARIYKGTKMISHEQNADFLILTLVGLGDDDVLYGLAGRFKRVPE
jgi:hypothetical protein